jgi:oxygen-independent coproporphyrinogen-3 oxidase
MLFQAACFAGHTHFKKACVIHVKLDAVVFRSNAHPPNALGIAVNLGGIRSLNSRSGVVEEFGHVVKVTCGSMAGLYFHIPFCVQACNYCDFHFSTQLGTRGKMVDAMIAEIERSQDLWGEECFETLYFGGGTPSVLSDEELARLAEAAMKLGAWNLKEWTLEANPEDLSRERLEGLAALGVTRLSIGIQSLDEKTLSWMNRAHSVEQARNAVADAASIGFQHISVDMIYGVPGLSLGDFKSQLQEVLAWPIDHLSSYILTAEPRTAYGHSIAKGLISEAPSEVIAQQYAALCSASQAAGFSHYETSNFSRPGGEGLHNSRYWAGSAYLGIGPGAHSFKGRERWWNIANNPRYIREGACTERETLTARDRFNEIIMTGLRTLKGLDAGALKHETGIELVSQPAFSRYIDQDWLVEENGRIWLRPEHWLVGDAVAAALFVVAAE